MTMRAKLYQNSAVLLLFMRRTTIPHSSLLTPNWRVELSNAIKGRHAPGANPEPLIFPDSLCQTFYIFLVSH